MCGVVGGEVISIPLIILLLYLYSFYNEKVWVRVCVWGAFKRAKSCQCDQFYVLMVGIKLSGKTNL